MPGRHADPYGREFGQLNTIWVVEAGGLRVAHLGDNVPLTGAMADAIGDVDVLLIPVDDQDHILTAAEVDLLRERLAPRVTVPMHYRLTSLSDLPASVGPIDDWLSRQRNVRRLESHWATLSAETLPAAPSVWAFQPSPAVRPWRQAVRAVWALRDEARQRARDGDRAGAIERLREAVRLAPDVSVFGFDLAVSLRDASRDAAAMSVLTTSLAGAGRHDRAYTMRSRKLLAELHDEAGDGDLAAEQYRLIPAGSHNIEQRERATRYLAAHQ
ncbi:MAG: MBL fold metallo-hydrolase [Vicinamibacterales bacterium]|nr:MBL fold metallo-hydrolase [Vicinamibacterales bacterium]HJO38507.1 MBL fold metallo-hydrolase [Vicinamibacterales bacterium]